MNRLLRSCGLYLLLVALCGTAWGQFAPIKVSRIAVTNVGPAAASDEIIRANIRVKTGNPYLPAAVDDDVRNLYATGFFYNIRVARDRTDEGMVLTYIVQGKPRLTDIKVQGNKKISLSKIKKKITSKVGEPLDERKLFTDSRAIQELYQKKGYPKTEVTYVPNIDENAGRGTATFEIKESPKIKIIQVQFNGAHAFSEGTLRKQIKTRRRWMFSWLSGSGYFKDEQFQEDKEKLADYYRDHGYIDFEIKDVQFENPTPTKLIIRFNIYEGRQYKVGRITFQGTTMLPTNAVSHGFKPGPVPQRGPERTARTESLTLNKNFSMKEGDTFTVKGLSKDIGAVEDFYGTKGHIDVTSSSGNLKVARIANTETGTMDLQSEVDEGQKSFIEKIEIRGNAKTKDKVIRRELAVSPGEVFNMVGVKLSKQRLEGLQYFEPGKVDARPEPTDPPIVGRKNLVIGVEEKNTGNLTLGAGFSSVDAVVGFVEVSQGNFDLFNPPHFTGAGQKFRLRVQLGTQRKDFEVSFIEPWFLGRKLALGVDLYHREANYQSLGNLYNETRTGARVSLTRALGSDFLIGSVFYNVENVGILLDPSLHGNRTILGGPVGPGGGIPVFDPANVPQAILSEGGHTLLTRVGVSLAYDTRNSTFLPDAGQRTELLGQITSSHLGGERDFYKLELSSAWYFRGFSKGHVLELVGRGGVTDGLSGDTVPFYERFYLGGLYSLRGFRYRSISPREPGLSEPIGGDTYWFASAEYSIPIVQKEHVGGVRFAFFYDIGNVQSAPYNFTLSNFSDNWGIGLRLNLPIGPLRLDYGIPIHHDSDNNGSGRFQFGVGWQRPF
jgi:outer membrane protein insertion porin family